MPVTEIATGISIAKSAAGAINKLHDLYKSTQDRDLKQKIEDVIDELRDLKHQASLLEDENRDIKEQLRFRTDDYQFDGRFWMDKLHPDRTLCPKCFSEKIAAPVGQAYDNGHAIYRACLTCKGCYKVGETQNPYEPVQTRNDWPFKY